MFDFMLVFSIIGVTQSDKFSPATSESREYHSLDLKSFSSSKVYDDPTHLCPCDFTLDINIGEISIVLLEDNMEFSSVVTGDEFSCISGGILNPTVYFKLIPKTFTDICTKGILQSHTDIESLLPVNHFL